MSRRQITHVDLTGDSRNQSNAAEFVECSQPMHVTNNCNNITDESSTDSNVSESYATATVEDSLVMSVRDRRIDLPDASSNLSYVSELNATGTVRNPLPMNIRCIDLSGDHSNQIYMNESIAAGTIENSGPNDTSHRHIDLADLADGRSNQSYMSESNAAETVNDSEPIDSKIEKVMKQLTMSEMKFMENFDPNTSNREMRKLDRKIQPPEKNKSGRVLAAHDEKGILKASGKDLCDCLDEACPGCHFPCRKCRSCKCGTICRQNRKYAVESVVIEGKNSVIVNKFM